MEPVEFGTGEPGRRSNPLLRTALGEALRRIRLEQSRTLADVARAAGVSMPYLSELERGRKEGSSEVLAAICDALRVELSDLLAIVWGDLVEERRHRAPVIRLNVRSQAVSTPTTGARGQRTVRTNWTMAA